MLFHESLSQKSAALLLGIVFGIKEQLPEDFLLALQKGGLMHVIAASGMNISMVANMLLLVFGKFLERKIAIFISIVCILFYAYLAGFEPSIVRAASMGIIGFSAALLGRQYYALSALLITAFGMLFLDPNLLFDVGFQLSFAATIGILFIQPLLTVDILFTHIQDQHNWIRNLPLIDDLKTTFAAQVATFPIIMVVFGQIGVLSLFVNLLVLWTIPPLMILGGIGALLGLFIPILGKAFILLTIPLLLFFEFITDFFGQFPTTLAVVSISWFFILGYYFMLFALVIFLQQKKYEKTSSNTH